LQTVASHNNRLGVIDALGTAWIARVEENPPSSLSFKDALSLPQPASTHCEPGWAGLAFHPSDQDQLATATFFAKRISVFTQNNLLLQIPAIANPTQLAYFSFAGSHSPLLAWTEHHQLVLWDLRASTCAQRLMVFLSFFVISISLY
jgi:hypothetical protein